MFISFLSADMSTHQKIMVVGLMFCAAFMTITLFAGEQPDDNHKAGKLVRSAGTPSKAR